MVIPKINSQAKKSSILSRLACITFLLFTATFLFTSDDSEDVTSSPQYETTSDKPQQLRVPTHPSTVEHDEEVFVDVFVDIENDLESTNDGVMPLNPKGIQMGKSEVFYMLPSDLTFDKEKEAPEVVGILLFFHGCNHKGGADFFLLPEHRIVARTALQRGLAVVAPTSLDRTTGCWHFQNDVEQFEKDDVLEEWKRHVGLVEVEEEPATDDKKKKKKKKKKKQVKKKDMKTLDLPIIGMGASSGGAVLKFMLKIIPFKSIAPYIMTLKWEKDDLERGYLLQNNTGTTERGNDLPPTAFVRMTLDEFRTRSIDKISETLTDHDFTHVVFDIEPKPFTFKRCAARLPELAKGEEENKEVCKSMIELMQRIPVVNTQTYMLNKEEVPEMVVSNFAIEEADDDYVDEEKARVKVKAITDVAVPKRGYGGRTWLYAALQEEIQTCYGRHEMTAEHHEDVLTWLMKQAGLSVEKYEKKEEKLIEEEDSGDEGDVENVEDDQKEGGKGDKKKKKKKADGKGK